MTIEAAERIVEFPALKEAQGALDARRKELRDVLAEAGDTYEMGNVKSLQGDSQSKVDWIRAKNAEIDDLKKKVDDHLVVARAAGAAMEDRKGEQGADAKDNRDATRTKDGRLKSVGRLFVESPAFKAYARGSGGGPQASMDIDLKTVFSTGVGWAPETTRTGHVEMFPTRPAPVVADLIPQTTTNQAAVVYMEEIVYVNNAAEVNEGDQFPEAQLQLTERSSQVRKIPVFVPITDETFEDEPRAEDYINNRLPFMLRQRLDLQILQGNGTAPNLTGTANVTGHQVQAKGGDTTPDALYKGMRLVREVGFAEPSVVFITPTKWEPIQLLKTADGIYIWGHPSQMGPTTIWGVPVVQTTAAPATKALIGDYRNFSELAVRRGIDVQVSNSHGDFFARGQLAVRADVRCALIHYRPLAFAEVSGL